GGAGAGAWGAGVVAGAGVAAWEGFVPAAGVVTGAAGDAGAVLGAGVAAWGGGEVWPELSANRLASAGPPASSINTSAATIASCQPRRVLEILFAFVTVYILCLFYCC